MKLRKILCMAAVSATVAITGLPAANAPVLVHAEETQVIDTSELDNIIRQAYTLYLNQDYSGMYTLKQQLTSSYGSQIMESGADRYICDIDGNIKGMLIIAYDGENSFTHFYFGQTENNLRHGSGTSIIFHEGNTTDIYTGSYNADLPSGNGTLTILYNPDGRQWSISGDFQGSYLNGIYQVTAIYEGQTCSFPAPYVNNHLQDFDAIVSGTNLDGTGSIWYSAHNYLEVYWSAYDDDCNFWTDFLLDQESNGSELFVLGVFKETSQGRYISSFFKFENEILVLHGNPAGINFTGSFSPVTASVTPAPETPVADPVTTPTVTEPEATTLQPITTPNTYIVQRNDNLSKIAQKIYGDKKYWRVIYEANSNVIKSDYIIWANQVLVIPTL